MPAAVLIGAQWGDEGKGKATDLLGSRLDYVVKFNGGNNAGHTVVVGDEKYALHLLPSGILTPGVVPVIDASSMTEAVEQGYAAAAPDGVVLLAPACASFDWFRDYADRGRAFKEAVRALEQRGGMTRDEDGPRSPRDGRGGSGG